MLVDDEEVSVNAVAIAIAAMKESVMDYVVCSAAQKLVATTLRPLTPLLRLPTRCLQPPAAPPIAPSGTTSWRMQSHHASCRLPRVVMSQNIISPSHSCLGSFGQTFVYRQRLALWRRSWRSCCSDDRSPGYTDLARVNLQAQTDLSGIAAILRTTIITMEIDFGIEHRLILTCSI